MKKLTPKPKGFTIIEVIIVLVVGAVIMIAVFLVVPQLQQSARNSRRRSDAQRILISTRQCVEVGNCDLSQITTSLNCDSGILVPDSAEISSCIYKSLGEKLQDPLMKLDYRQYKTLTGSNVFGSYMWVRQGVKCSGSSFVVGSSSSIGLIYIEEPFSVNAGRFAPDNLDGQKRCIND